jgi:hypothetical protein
MNANEKPKRCRGEAGLTLQEMLIAMVVSAIIAVPIGGALFTSLHTTNSTIARTRETVDANLLSTYFGTDVQNAAQVATGSTDNCGGLAGLVLTATGGSTTISYYQGTGASTTNLYRHICNGATPTSTLVLVRNLAGPVNFSCVNASSTTVPCSAGWTAVQIVATQSNAQAAGLYTTTVQGQRRVS